MKGWRSGFGWGELAGRGADAQGERRSPEQSLGWVQSKVIWRERCARLGRLASPWMESWGREGGGL